MSLDPGAGRGLLRAPLGDVPAVESLLDLPIQLVQVDLVDPVLKPGMAAVQPLDGAVMRRPFVPLALP